MKQLIYIGTESQLVDHHFIIQTEIIDDTVIRYATRDFTHGSDAIGVTLSSNNNKIKRDNNIIKILYCSECNHKYLKREIKDLIDANLVRVKDENK